uniref:plasmid mobilization protein n=1 Tax=Pedobacter schmidteae TaxID=2201271 RepID=UPI000EB49664|nr:plasmid mobilization relaxosome protein MobC [Pedobacter schmidteae]
MKDKNLKTKWVHFRLTEDEYNTLTGNSKVTTERQLSSYCRKMLTRQPMIKAVRNLSADELLIEFSALNKTLNGLANNFNQSVHKLHTLQLPVQFQKWLLANTADRVKLLESVDEIREMVRKIMQAW